MMGFLQVSARKREGSKELSRPTLRPCHLAVTTELRKTYNRGREVLYYLLWYRIVLDEGLFGKHAAYLINVD